MNEKRKILIIQEQVLSNCLMKKVLSSYFDVVATSTSSKDIKKLYHQYYPDLILTDIIIKNNNNSIFYSQEIKKIYGKNIKVLAITDVPEITFLNIVKEAGLDGLIYKNVTIEELVYSIKQVLNGYTLFPNNYNYSKDDDYLKKLSNKELKILTMLCNGLDRNTIANELNITLGTLKNYISTILNKTKFDNIFSLTVFCISNNYIIPNLKK